MEGQGEVERGKEGEGKILHLSGKKLVSTVGSFPNFPRTKLFGSEVSADSIDKSEVLRLKRKNCSTVPIATEKKDTSKIKQSS
jgi:hypothetical protein